MVSISNIYLIDDGVPSRGHRTNIMNPDFTHLGVSCGCHKSYGEMCCFNYGISVVPKNPSLVSAAAPQLNTCSAYTDSTPDATTGNVVLTALTPVYAATSAPSTGTTSTGSTGTTSGSTTTTSGATITSSVSTSTDSNGVITKVYTIIKKSGTRTSTYKYTWMGYSEADAPSVNDVMGYFGIS